MANVYEIVTEKIIEKLESGVIPWRKPWKSGSGAPQNLKSGRPYRGINVFLLAAQGYSSPYWLTFKQAKAMGGTVRRGEKGTKVVFWKWIEKKSTDDEAEKRFPILRYYTVFNVAAQCDGIELPADDESAPTFSPIEAAEDVVENMPNRPEITHGGSKACYAPGSDVVRMPERETFTSPAEYYSVLFHELAHSTSHEDRVGREISTSFGSETYSKEELVAEMSAAMLAGHCGIEEQTLDNSAAYIASWIKVFEGDPRLVVCAASAAQKAADYILDIEAPTSAE